MSGAPIGEMNTVRKHLSAVKGGHLAMAAAPAKVVTLAISDVPFDDPSTIASGPTVPDPTTLADTKQLIEKYKIEITKPAQEHLDSPLSETPKKDDPVFQNCTFSMISTPSEMLDIVVQKCRKDGHFVETLGANIEGEAKDVGQQHAELARSAKRENKTKLILSGGETTVTVDAQKPSGKGGRNVEYLLSLAIALKGEEGIYAIAADTDGIDGSEDNAGAIITPDTLARAKALNLDAEKMLEHHDAYSFFEALGDLVMTGPTRTNVNDFRAIFIAANSSS
jgi:hydroxypyruvate reductase